MSATQPNPGISKIWPMESHHLVSSATFESRVDLRCTAHPEPAPHTRPRSHVVHSTHPSQLGTQATQSAHSERSGVGAVCSAGPKPAGAACSIQDAACTGATCSTVLDQPVSTGSGIGRAMGLSPHHSSSLWTQPILL